jgi:AP-4 complex subunit epsilon-1
MLGFPADYGYIVAVNNTQTQPEQTLVDKRTAYLASSLLLHESHELVMLLISSIKRDLASDNFMAVCAALTVVAKIMNAEYVFLFTTGWFVRVYDWLLRFL